MTEVRWVNPLNEPTWDEGLLAPDSGGSFSHTAAWARVLHESYQYTPLYLTELRAGRLTTLVALMEVASWLTGKRGVSLPFTDACDPIIKNPAEFEDVFERVIALGRKRGWRTIGLRGGGAFLPATPASTSYWGHIVPLDTDPTALLRRLAPATRRAIRKSEKSDLSVTISASEDSLWSFYGLFCHTRKRHGVPPPPPRFFGNIQRHLLARGRGTIILAHHQGKAVAGSLFFHFGKVVHMKFAASNQTYQQLRPNNFVMWTALKHFAEQGFGQLDLGRTSEANTGLRRFKLQWGANERPIKYFTYHCRSREFIPRRDRSSGRMNALLRLLPTTVLNAIGAALYRHVG